MGMIGIGGSRGDEQRRENQTLERKIRQLRERRRGSRSLGNRPPWEAMGAKLDRDGVGS
jgi:hypothetical protein